MRTYCLTPTRANRALDRLIADFWHRPDFDSEPQSEFVPRVNVIDSPDNLKLTFELPGMGKDDIKIFVKDDVLTVSGERKFESGSESEGSLRREIRSGSFSRSFTLPDSLEVEKIAADYKNGLLEITLPKKEEKKPKEIEVKVE